ncbi:DNA primase [uncultured Eubacterium sp.]|nr:DNA primase [uncultured Eubacterium sp.]
MGFSFSNHTIENLKNQINIIDVVGRVVPLKRAGSNYKGVCPFHNEKTPSFVVSEPKQIFTCFGCGATGDAIEFVKRYYNLDFSEAIEKLAGEYGIALEKNTFNDNREVYYKVNKLAANFFYKAFTEKANKGYAYMKRRGISPAILKKFGIGYADAQWDSLYKYLLSQGVDKKIMVELGLVSESKGKYYDKFRNRVIFPIINTSGKVIGFGGRAIDAEDNPKYLNSAESKIFQKKYNLYGLNISRQSVGKEGFIILVEGYMDTIALYQSGIENVAASLGTALTENQAKLIKRYTRDVILSYDADGAGRAAALRGLDILRKEECKVKVLHVTDGKDPDEYIKKNGKTAFLKLVEDALPYGDYKLESAKAGYDLAKDEDKIDYIKKATDIIRQLGPVEQEIYIKKLSKDLKIAEGAIRMELLGNDSTEKASFTQTREEKEEISSSEITPIEKTLLKVMLTDESYISRIADFPQILESDFAVRIYETLAEEYRRNQLIDLNKIMDGLTSEGAACLQEIMDHIIVGGNEEKVFDDCIKTWKDKNLAKEEQRLISLLSMADEEDNQERIRELTDQLMKVQKERKTNSRGI